MSKIVVFLGIVILIFLSACKTAENEEDQENPDLIRNEHILAKTLLHTQLISIPSIMSMSYAEMRDSLISKLDEKSGNSVSFLQKLSDKELCQGALMYKFLLEAGVHSPQQLLTMTLDDFRNVVIEQNGKNTGISLSQLQAYGNNENLKIAYNWWFYNNVQIKQIIDKLNNVSGSNPTFDLKDSDKNGMDVLRIVKADEAYVYLGVYHSMSNENHFKLYLAGSNDLKNWIKITELGDRSHQGDIKKWGTGYLVVNEQDPVQGSNSIQIRYYSSYTNLIENKPANVKSIPQTFSTLAEGTPDIQMIEGSSPSDSHILLGYHFYDNGIRDQLAFGILQNFSNWRTWKDVISNQNIQEMGFSGNIGGRSGFNHFGNFVLQEAQINAGDWGSWRFLLGNGAFYYQLQPVTPKKSVSFANPGVAFIGSNSFAITGFMHSAGNKEGERGELLYTIDFGFENL